MARRSDKHFAERVHVCGTASFILPSSAPLTSSPSAPRQLGAIKSLDGAAAPPSRPRTPTAPMHRPVIAPSTRRIGTHTAEPRHILFPLEAARLTAASTVDLAPMRPARAFRLPGEPPRAAGGSADELARIKLAARAAFHGPAHAELRAARRQKLAAELPGHSLRPARVDRHAQVWSMALSEEDSRLIRAGTLTDSAYERVHGTSVVALQEQLERLQMDLWEAQAYTHGAMVGQDARPSPAPPMAARAPRGGEGGGQGVVRRRRSLPSERRGRPHAQHALGGGAAGPPGAAASPGPEGAQ